MEAQELPQAFLAVQSLMLVAVAVVQMLVLVVQVALVGAVLVD